MKRKKTAMLLCTAALACTMSFPAFAAQTKAEYRDESAQTRQELETTGNEISRIKDENKTCAAQCKETVSYTHLDVYKRQPSALPNPPQQPDPRPSPGPRPSHDT